MLDNKRKVHLLFLIFEWDTQLNRVQMFQYFDSEVTRTQFRTSVDSNVMASGRELQPDASASWHCMGFLGQLGEGRS